jgi:phosphohistidine phosphatase SixA
MKMRWRMAVVGLGSLALLGAAPSPGLRGQAFVRLPDGEIGKAIAKVQLTFISDDGSQVHTASTDSTGSYSITLPAARYYVRAAHRDFQDDWSAPGFRVVSDTATRTMNVFLREPQATTVLIVRHAEKQNPASEDPAEPLSAAGKARAKALRDFLFRAHVTGIYSTDTTRTRDTVKPLGDLLRLTTVIYDNAPALASAILADHRGDVVLVAAHSNTVGPIANALGANVPADSIGDFDNLYAVTKAGNFVKVVNLQYGADSTPDIEKNGGSLITILLAQALDSPSSAEAQELLHAVRKARVGAIHMNGGTALVRSLASALGIAPATFTSATLATTMNDLLSSAPAKPVLIVGSHDDLRKIIGRLGAHPTPIISQTDRDNLILVTRLPSRATRAVPLRY